MSQQIMPIVSIVRAAFDEMSDIQFLAIKEFNGKLVEDEGGQAVNTTGDLATLTADTGKDMYLGKAHASVSLDGLGTTAGVGTIVLKVNGLVKDTWNFALLAGSGEAGTTMDDHEFLIGFKVVTGQIIKLECTVAGTDVLTQGQIECWEESTGQSPQIPPLNPV